MALARYSDQFWFPNGALAANVEARVFPEGSNAFASLFTDASGAIPLANPAATDGTGTLTFWAETGSYWVHLDTESFLVTVGMSQEQADLSTGVASGGEISVNAVDPLAVDISAVDGYIVDYLVSPQFEPTVTRVKTPDQTVPLDAAALLRTVTWWLLDSAGNVIQQGTTPTNEEQRTHIVLGVTTLVGGSIINSLALPVILPQQANQLVDLMDALGGFSIQGNLVTANGANRKINQSAGQMFSRAFRHFSGSTLTNNPHISDTQAQSPAEFRLATQATTVFGGTVTDLDVANFDSGGVITPIGGGSNQSSVFRVFLFPTVNAPEQLLIQYGQKTHGSLSAAVNSIGQAGFVVNPVVPGNNGALIAYVVATRTAVNLSDPTQAVIVTAGKFATP